MPRPIGRSRSVLNSIETVDAVQIDLSTADQYFYFEPEIFGVPAGIEVTVVPSTLTLDWEDRVERTLPIRVQRVGDLPEGLKLVSEAQAQPRRVRISGPRSIVQSMNEVITDPVDVAVAGVGEHTRRVRLSALPQGVQTPDTKDVSVRFAVAARENQRKLQRLEVAPLGHAGTVHIRPSRVNVVLAGAEGTLSGIDAEHVVPVVQLDQVDFTAGENVPATVSVRGLPAGVRASSVEPAEVLVSER